MYAITINLIFHSGLTIPFGYCAFSQFLGEDRETGEGSGEGSELTPAMKYTARSSAARETSPDGRQQSSSWMAMVAPEKQPATIGQEVAVVALTVQNDSATYAGCVSSMRQIHELIQDSE